MRVDIKIVGTRDLDDAELVEGLVVAGLIPFLRRNEFGGIIEKVGGRNEGFFIKNLLPGVIKVGLIILKIGDNFGFIFEGGGGN